MLYSTGPDTVYLSPAPLYHAAPLRFCMTMMRFGGTVIVMEHFDPEKALALIERHAVTHSRWVPAMFVRMLKLAPEIRARYGYDTLKVAIHAAAPCPVEAKRRMISTSGCCATAAGRAGRAASCRQAGNCPPQAMRCRRRAGGAGAASSRRAVPCRSSAGA